MIGLVQKMSKPLFSWTTRNIKKIFDEYEALHGKKSIPVLHNAIGFNLGLFWIFVFIDRHNGKLIRVWVRKYSQEEMKKRWKNE